MSKPKDFLIIGAYDYLRSHGLVEAQRKVVLFDELVEACAEAWATLKVYKHKTPIVAKLDAVLAKAREVGRFE